MFKNIKIEKNIKKRLTRRMQENEGNIKEYK